ncbi:hypothetical protein [Gorillibacterium timonense]|uniref:hypothetical protein n=1 Tax=Gorillibacterium timonense TaxID=1689269 RepID=UPI00071C717F|nr:hypothetical protein [Gorillibacterium timonense]
MATSINFNSIVTNSMNTTSGVFIGDNQMIGWDAHSKRFNGVGEVFGQYNLISNPYLLINNNSLFDTMINDNDLNTSNESVVGP